MYIHICDINIITIWYKIYKCMSVHNNDDIVY